MVTLDSFIASLPKEEQAAIERRAACLLGDLPDIEIKPNPFWQPLSRRGRRRLRGGKTQQARPRFKPWDPRVPVTVARGATVFVGA